MLAWEPGVRLWLCVQEARWPWTSGPFCKLSLLACEMEREGL